MKCKHPICKPCPANPLGFCLCKNPNVEQNEGIITGILSAEDIQRIKNPHAVALGRLGGKAGKGVPKPRSAENGKKGGRPKKPVEKNPEFNA